MPTMPEKLAVIALLLLAILLPGPFVAGQEHPTAAEFPAEFAEDSRLQMPITLDMRGGSIGEIVARLGQLTGVPLTIDPAQADQPFAGLVGRAPGWHFMRQIAVTGEVKASWHPTADGYRLNFQHEPESSSTGRGKTLAWLFALGAPLLLIGIVIVRSARRAAPTTTTRTAGTGTSARPLQGNAP